MLTPLRFFLVIIHGIIPKRVGISVLWPEMLALPALGVFFFGLGVARFRRTLD
jgi:ABC-2 type transport system permease protein